MPQVGDGTLLHFLMELSSNLRSLTIAIRRQVVCSPPLSSALLCSDPK